MWGRVAMAAVVRRIESVKNEIPEWILILTFHIE